MFKKPSLNSTDVRVQLERIRIFGGYHNSSVVTRAFYCMCVEGGVVEVLQHEKNTAN